MHNSFICSDSFRSSLLHLLAITLVVVFTFVWQDLWCCWLLFLLEPLILIHLSCTSLRFRLCSFPSFLWTVECWFSCFVNKYRFRLWISSWLPIVTLSQTCKSDNCLCFIFQHFCFILCLFSVTNNAAETYSLFFNLLLISSCAGETLIPYSGVFQYSKTTIEQFF